MARNTSPAASSDLEAGKWVAIFGPNMDKVNTQLYNARPEGFPSDEDSPEIHMMANPETPAILMGIPLLISDYLTPFIITDLFHPKTGDHVRRIVIDIRSLLVCPLDDSYVSSYFNVPTNLKEALNVRSKANSLSKGSRNPH